MSRSRSCVWTMRARSSSSDGNASPRPLVRRRLQTEVLDDGGCDVDDALGRRLETDREHGNLGIADCERTVAAAAGGMASREIVEPHPGPRGHDDVPGPR